MKKLNFLGFPIALLYGLGMLLRNMLFKSGILYSNSIPLPSIGVGNLSVGGTGKSVVIMYLLDLLSERKKVGVLSRGYKRITKGVLQADKDSSAATIGDEPYQFYKAYPGIDVVVAEKRQEGVRHFQESLPSVEVLLLDDVYQHQYVTPSLMVLTTSFDAPFYRDFLLPVGNLREPRNGKSRADIILVTKCPRGIDAKQKQEILNAIKPALHQKVYFTTIKYSEWIQNETEKKHLKSFLTAPFVLVTGIANAAPLVSYLHELGLEFEHLAFPDHHLFSKKEAAEIAKQSKERFILTTQKDYHRLLLNWKSTQIYYLPIQMQFLFAEEEQQFKHQIASVM
jgi:tetraacyldisaccharide 4'-kinase